MNLIKELHTLFIKFRHPLDGVSIAIIKHAEQQHSRQKWRERRKAKERAQKTTQGEREKQTQTQELLNAVRRRQRRTGRQHQAVEPRGPKPRGPWGPVGPQDQPQGIGCRWQREMSLDQGSLQNCSGPDQVIAGTRRCVSQIRVTIHKH